MKIYNNEIFCQRGESLQINRRFVNADDTPFIVPTGLHNPYLCLTVASVSNEQKNRYLKNWWAAFDVADAKNYSIDGYFAKGGLLRFDDTIPFDLTQLTTTSGGTTKSYANWSEVPANPNASLSGYIGTTSVTFPLLTILAGDTEYPYYKDCVFCAPASATDSTILYKYCCKTGTGLLAPLEWREYNFDIAFNIGKDDTINWVSQNYLYSINLYAGVSTQYAYLSLGLSVDLSNVYGKGLNYIIDEYPEVYDILKNYANLLKAVTNGVPLCAIDFSQVLLKPTKIVVDTNLKGGLAIE